MNRISKIPLYWWLLLSLVGCRNHPSSVGAERPFLEGTWIMTGGEAPEKRFVEEWKMDNDSSLTGNGYLLNTETGDRFNTEQLWMRLETGGWTYYARPVNSTSETAFRATKANNREMMFENPGHDFPQYIRYELLSGDSLMVTIGDTSRSNSWKMVRYP